MIVKRFASEDVEKISCADDFYKMVGVLEHKVHYANMFISPKTNDNIKKAMEKNMSKFAKKVGSKSRAKVAQTANWWNYSPVFEGPRYDEFRSVMGHLVTNAIYILEPGDSMYKEHSNG